jgi:methyl-accepting chemotaxis protein
MDWVRTLGCAHEAEDRLNKKMRQQDAESEMAFKVLQQGLHSVKEEFSSVRSIFNRTHETAQSAKNSADMLNDQVCRMNSTMT